MQAGSVAWLLDSGGAGRGAWQGGVLYEFLLWARSSGRYPSIMMGASAGGYAAADVATGTEKTVLKGWTAWGNDDLLAQYPAPEAIRHSRPRSKFRLHLHASLQYVMDEEEINGVFDGNPHKRLLVFTTRVRRRDGRPLGRIDEFRLLLKSATRKLPRALKYLPRCYQEDPVIFATNLPPSLTSEYARPLTTSNYRRVLEASCLIPLAMGPPLLPDQLDAGIGRPPETGDERALFIDGGYTLKMPMAVFEEDPRFSRLARWAAADRTIIFCCDPKGHLWENSSRLRRLNGHPAVNRARAENRLLVIYPDHRVEADFLCLDNDKIMRTFRSGREQGRRLLARDDVRAFLAG